MSYLSVGQDRLCPTSVVPAPGAVEACAKLGIKAGDPRWGCCVEDMTDKIMSGEHPGAGADARSAGSLVLPVALVLGAVLLIGGR